MNLFCLWKCNAAQSVLHRHCSHPAQSCLDRHWSSLTPSLSPNPTLVPSSPACYTKASHSFGLALRWLLSALWIGHHATQIRLGASSDQLCHDMGILPWLCLFPPSPQLRLGLSAAPGNVVLPAPLVQTFVSRRHGLRDLRLRLISPPLQHHRAPPFLQLHLCPHSNYCRLLYPGSTLAACHHVSALVSWSTCVAQSLSPSDSAWASTSASVTSCHLGSKVHHGSFLHQFHHGSSSLSSVFFFSRHIAV